MVLSLYLNQEKKNIKVKVAVKLGETHQTFVLTDLLTGLLDIEINQNLYIVKSERKTYILCPNEIRRCILPYSEWKVVGGAGVSGGADSAASAGQCAGAARLYVTRVEMKQIAIRGLAAARKLCSFIFSLKTG